QSIKLDKSVGFMRNIRVASSGKALQALILQKHPAWSVIRADDRRIFIDTGKDVLVAMLVGGDKARLVEHKEGGSELIALQIPASGNPRTIQVAIVQMDNLDDDRVENFSAAIDNREIPNFDQIKKGGPAQW